MFKNKSKIVNKGFTLIEILVVIGLIAILAAIVLIAINPARQFAQARNSQRESNVNTILNAIGQNMADNKGTFGGVCGALLPIPTAVDSIDDAAGGLGINLSCLAPTYIASAMPRDPSQAAGADTGYTVEVDATGRTKVCAPKYSEVALGSPAPYCLTR